MTCPSAFHSQMLRAAPRSARKQTASPGPGEADSAVAAVLAGCGSTVADSESAADPGGSAPSP